MYRFAFAVRFSIDSVVYNVVGEAYRMHGMVKRSMLKQKLYFNIFFPEIIIREKCDFLLECSMHGHFCDARIDFVR